MAPAREPIKPTIKRREASDAETGVPLVDSLTAAETADKAPKPQRGTRRTSRRGDAAESRTEPPMPRPGVIANGMTRVYAQTGAMVGMFDMQCGSAIMENAENVGKAWENLAKQNPAVRRALMTLMTGNALFEIVTAHTPMILAIMAHHGPDKAKALGSLGVMAMKAAEDAA